MKAPATPRGTLAGRILAVVAAMSLVLAFALAALFPPTLSLGQFIATIDHAAMVAIQDFVRGHISVWLWTNIMVPVLARPAWLLPTSVGLVAVGAAVTLNSRQKAPRSRRRRS